MLDRIRKGVRLRTNNVSEAPAAAKRDPKKVQVKRLGQALRSGGGGQGFEESPVDLAEIGRAYYTDSYIRRAVDKHSALMFKNGWELSGKNDQAVEYVWTRLKLMSEGTGQSIDAFLQEIADNLVLYGNSYIVKARAKTGSMPAGVTAVGYTGKQPIAGYFVLPAHLVTINRDETGKILGYQQTTGTGGGEGIEFKPEDIVHYPYRRPSGRAYGVPFIFNALDDVKLLRQIEENVARLIYRNLFPLYLYKVGIDKPGFEATDEEIENLREEIRNIPVDGALVVPERHSIEVVGSQGQAIDANGYLRYFRQRVFSGLGVSDTIMGVSDTANRSTSDNQSADLNDSVKDFQKVFADITKFFIINELLFEGGFDPVLNPDDEVEFLFHEIEFDAKIKRENHVIQMFMQNSITFEEMRQLLGHDTTVDESRLFANMFGSAVSTEGAAAQGNNQDQPENQHGKQQSPGKPDRSKENRSHSVSENTQLTQGGQVVTLQEALQVGAFANKVERYWSDTMEDVQARIQKQEGMDNVISFTTGLTGRLIKEQIHPFVEKAFLYGFQEGLNQLGNHFAKLSPGDVQIAVGRHSRSFEKLMADVTSSVSSAYEKDSPTAHVSHAFTASRFRIGFIAKRISFEAYNYGVALAAEKSKKETVFIRHKENCCKTCLTAPGEIPLREGWREQLPPHHTNCECTVVLTNKEVI
ncbi:phage portal protein [Cytobacillus oceanisediminis]|uniref:phage portal protein n=1 Tax=Cytobacillus oceanisediminis TaxID=665099 RepID=UPI001FB36C02|nr:phage portal protein [Cytobacillus oceanisediminis]UOE58225.1 phage portal protein [Cytobacillus oceanisediminis]